MRSSLAVGAQIWVSLRDAQFNDIFARWHDSMTARMCVCQRRSYARPSWWNKRLGGQIAQEWEDGFGRYEYPPPLD